MVRQKSRRWPPSTGYERPTERRFYVWQDRRVTYALDFSRKYRWERHPWRWLCTMCDPPSEGCRVQQGAWLKIITISMPRHFAVRYAHHKHVAEHHG